MDTKLIPYKSIEKHGLRKDQMWCLSVQQPYATLIAQGFKTIEVRTWVPKITGRILIASSRTLGAHVSKTVYPVGVAICTVEIIGYRPMKESDVDAAYTEFNSDGLCWGLREPYKVEPFPIKGRTRLFKVPFVDPYNSAT